MYYLYLSIDINVLLVCVCLDRNIVHFGSAYRQLLLTWSHSFVKCFF